MILARSYLVPVEEEMYSRSDAFFKGECGMVDADPRRSGCNQIFQSPNEKIFVWEDEGGVGIFRVDVWNNYERNLGHDLFNFCYWSSSRLTREICLRDPMKLVIERFEGQVKHYELTGLPGSGFNCELTLEQISKSMGWGK